jgi:hypothetical protein
MKVAVISYQDIDVTDGMDDLFDKYGVENTTVLLPILKRDKQFSQSVVRACLDHGVKVHCFFTSAEGLDHLLKQADDVTVSDNPVKEVLLQLSTGDSLSLVWDDSPQAHFALHSVEDLAIDVWDITDGIDPIELEAEDYGDMDATELHASMHKHLGMFVDLLAAFVAETVMSSISEAVAQHIMEAETKRDVSPFRDEDLN